MAEIVADEGGEALRDGAEEMLENVYLRATAGDDFVGVQCYTRMHFGPEVVNPNDPGVPRHPDGRRVLAPVRGVLRPPGRRRERAARSSSPRTGSPPPTTPSASPTSSEALRSAHRCLEEGIDLRGYFVWSLLDNFEWHLGYGPKFGLVAVAPGIFERRPKPSAHWFGDVARTGPSGHSGVLAPMPGGQTPVGLGCRSA